MVEGSRNIVDDPEVDNRKPQWATHSPFLQGQNSQQQNSTSTNPFTSATSQVEPPTSFFNSTSQAGPSSGLFSLPANNQQPSSPFTFGNAGNQQKPAQSFSVFSQPPPASSSNLFGTSSQQSSQSASNGLDFFGKFAKSQVPITQSAGSMDAPDDAMSISPPHETLQNSQDGRSNNGSLLSRISEAPQLPSDAVLNLHNDTPTPFSKGPLTSISWPPPNTVEIPPQFSTNGVSDQSSERGLESLNSKPIVNLSPNTNSLFSGFSKGSNPHDQTPSGPNKSAQQSHQFSSPTVTKSANTTMSKPFFASSFPQPTPSFSLTGSNILANQSNSIFQNPSKVSGSNKSQDTVQKFSPSASLLQRPLTQDQLNALMPPSTPVSFSEAQKQEYVTRYRLRSLNTAFKKNIDVSLSYPVTSDTLRFYESKIDEILGAGGFPIATAGLKRKSNNDSSSDDSTIPSKRHNVNGFLSDGDSAKAPRFASTAASNKRKSDEDITKHNGLNGSIESAKKARNDLSYPSLPSAQTSGTASLFAQIANNESSGTATPSDLSSEAAILFHASRKPTGSLFEPATKPVDSQDTASAASSPFSKPSSGNSASSASLFTPKSASTSNTASDQPFLGGLQLKPINTSTTPSTKASAFGSGAVSAGSNTTSKASNASQSSEFKVPSFGAPSGTNHLHQFGQKAQKDEAEMAKEAKAKRKAEEFDSEDEDTNEEEWERKYEEEQRGKRQKIQEARKNDRLKFVFGSGSETSDQVQGKGANEVMSSVTTSDIFKPAPPTSGVFPSFPSGSSGNSSVFVSPSPNIELSNPFANLNSNPFANHNKHGPDAEDDNSVHAEYNNETITQRVDIGSSDTLKSSSPLNSRSMFDRIEKNADGSLKREKPTRSEKEQKNAGDLHSLLSTQNKKFSSSFSFGQPITSQASTGSIAISKTAQPENLFSLSSSTTPQAKSGKSLFENPFASTTGNSSATSPDSQLDNTWKADSPIKFGGSSTAPSLNVTAPSPSKPASNSHTNLFGSNASLTPSPSQASVLGTTSTIAPSITSGFNFGAPLTSSTPSSTVGFGFGGPPKPFASLAAPSVLNSANSSRATSPGFSTGGESATEGGEDDAQSDAQVDIASGRAGEENETVLFEVKAKAMELDVNMKLEEKQRKLEWILRGVGQLRVLRHHDTGKTRVLLRAVPTGKIALNAALMSGMDYKQATEKSVTFGAATGAGRIAKWTVMVGKKEDAAKLAGLLEENKFN